MGHNKCVIFELADQRDEIYLFVTKKYAMLLSQDTLDRLHRGARSMELLVNRIKPHVCIFLAHNHNNDFLEFTNIM